MKRPALYLVAGVIGFQLLIIAGTLIGCFTVYPKIVNRDPGDERCSGENIATIMSQVTAGAFSLYAAEK
jgi:hypothetical protein